MSGALEHGPAYRHFVITRYFVRFSDSEADIAAMRSPDLGWLESRLEIFRDICLPSVVAQTDQAFIWHLYFDRYTPADYLDRVRALISPYPNFRIVLCDAFDNEARAAAIRSELEPDVGWLLTTRLDNDDGWRCDFIERLHADMTFDFAQCLNFTLGLIWSGGMTLLYRHPSNAFISMLEPVEGFQTVWCAQHPDLGRVAPVRQIEAPPAFIQVLHARNRSNKPRGLRVARSKALKGFEALTLPAARTTDERSLRLIVFNLTRPPVWILRDAAIAIVRRLSRGTRRV